MYLYIIRHGDPIYATDSLTERGKLQAEAVAKRLEKEGINKIYCSPMGRARMTAEPTCRRLGMSYEVEEWSHEILPIYNWTEIPDGTKKSFTRLQNTYYLENGDATLPIDKSFECLPFRESTMRIPIEEIAKNGRDFLERLGYKKEGEVYKILRPNEDKVAFFCHGAFTKAWLSDLLYVPPHIMWASFAVTHTGITLLEFQNNENGVTAPKCLYLSDMGHLYADGLDTVYDFHTPERKEAIENQ